MQGVKDPLNNAPVRADELARCCPNVQVLLGYACLRFDIRPASVMLQAGRQAGRLHAAVGLPNVLARGAPRICWQDGRCVFPPPSNTSCCCVPLLLFRR